MTHFFIGATAQSEPVASHDLASWDAMLDAAKRGDAGAVERLITRPPKLVPQAELRNIPSPLAKTLGDVSRRFWEAYAKKHPRPAKPRGVGTSVSMSPAMMALFRERAGRGK